MTSQDPMFSVEDTPASHLVTPGLDEANTTNGTYFHSLPKPFANYDPNTQSWKMYPAISLWGSEPYSETWPRSGITRDGIAYRLPPSARRTYATESSLLLWTPTAKANYSAPSFRNQKGLLGYRDPTFVEWLMGFPIGWTDLEDLEMPLSHKSPNTSEEL